MVQDTLLFTSRAKCGRFWIAAIALGPEYALI